MKLLAERIRERRCEISAEVYTRSISKKVRNLVKRLDDDPKEKPSATPNQIKLDPTVTLLSKNTTNGRRQRDARALIRNWKLEPGTDSYGSSQGRRGARNSKRGAYRRWSYAFQSESVHVQHGEDQPTRKTSWYWLKYHTPLEKVYLLAVISPPHRHDD